MLEGSYTSLCAGASCVKCKYCTRLPDSVVYSGFIVVVYIPQEACFLQDQERKIHLEREKNGKNC